MRCAIVMLLLLALGACKPAGPVGIPGAGGGGVVKRMFPVEVQAVASADQPGPSVPGSKEWKQESWQR